MTATVNEDYSILTTTTTISATIPGKRRKRTDSYIEDTVDLFDIIADNTPREGSETLSVELTSATFAGGTALAVSDTVLTYTIEDASGISASLTTNDIVLTYCTLADIRWNFSWGQGERNCRMAEIACRLGETRGVDGSDRKGKIPPHHFF